MNLFRKIFTALVVVALLAGCADEVVEVPLPHWRGPSDVFHLMSILSPLDRDLALEVHPVTPIALTAPAFICDQHLGSLARRLRMKAWPRRRSAAGVNRLPEASPKSGSGGSASARGRPGTARQALNRALAESRRQRRV